MLAYTILAPLAMLASSVSAYGNARVVNNCSSTVYLNKILQYGATQFTNLALAPKGIYSEPLTASTGNSLTASFTPSGNNSAMAFSLSTGQYGGLYWELAQTNGPPKSASADPFYRNGSRIVTSDTACTSVVCPANYPGPNCTGAASQANPYVVQYCEPNTNLTFTLCSG